MDLITGGSIALIAYITGLLIGRNQYNRFEKQTNDLMKAKDELIEGLEAKVRRHELTRKELDDKINLFMEEIETHKKTDLKKSNKPKRKKQ